MPHDNQISQNDFDAAGFSAHTFCTMKWDQLLCEDRIRPTTKQPEERRGEIHRDYGRVVFSSPVRRLQDKAQVFPLETIDAVRTRLTHSLEVSSVSRGLANVVAKELLGKGEINLEQAYDIETVAATCGLVHDLGNPPFGHAGEMAIQEWFRKQPDEFWSFDTTSTRRYKNDMENYEGNAQTIRLLGTLQILSDRTGLNLTFATLSAAIKYTSNSSEIGLNGRQSKKKLGYFTSEESLVKKVQNATGTGDARNPITFLVEASDDMVYSVVDIEDGIKKGVISWTEVRDILERKKSVISESLYDECVLKAEKRINEAPFPISGRNWQEAVSQYFRTLVIVKGHDAVRKAFFKNYKQIMDGSYENELLYDSEVSSLYRVLKDEIGFKHIYNAKENLRLEVLGRNVIQFLMQTFWESKQSGKSKSFPEKIYHLLSKNYRTVFENPVGDEVGLPVEYRKALLVTDYICGMTDSFALNLRRELQHG
jgi:dGTPase